MLFLGREKNTAASGTIALVQPGLTAGRLADKIVVILLNFEILKIIYWMKYSTFCYV